MLRICVYMHSRFIENHPIRILKDGPLISDMVLSQVPEISSRTMSGSAEQCPTDNLSPMFIHCFGHILLTGCPIDSILFPLRS
jgi:hypothetical protein